MPSKSEPQTPAHNYERTSRPTGEDIYILTCTLHKHYYLPHPPLFPPLGDLPLNSFAFQFYPDPGKSRSSCKRETERSGKRFCIRLVVALLCSAVLLWASHLMVLANLLLPIFKMGMTRPIL